MRICRAQQAPRREARRLNRGVHRASLLGALLATLLLVPPPGAATSSPLPSASPAPTPRAVSAYQNPLAPPPDVPPCPRAEAAQLDGAVLVGDSIADGLVIHGLTPHLQLLTRVGLSPRRARTETLYKNDGEPVTLDRKLRAMRPSAVYLWLGTNGLDTGEADTILQDYVRLLDTLLIALPDTPFYLMALTPVATPLPPRYEGFTNDKIDTFNAGLREIARARGVYVLEPGAQLKGTDNSLRPEYAAEDGIHLREEAYRLIAEHLYTHLLPQVPGIDADATPPGGPSPRPDRSGSPTNPAASPPDTPG